MRDKFEPLFTLFAWCHSLYNASFPVDLEELGMCIAHFKLVYSLTEDAITSFLSYYRCAFPNASIIVKLHLLEDHIAPFLRKWGVGFGIMAEQGAESIHAELNSLTRRYVNITDRIERLRCVLKEYHLRCSPEVLAAKPIPRRKHKTS